MPEASQNPFQGTIYEPYNLSIQEPRLAAVMVDILDDSLCFQRLNRRMTRTELYTLSEQVKQRFSCHIGELFPLYPVDTGGFLNFILGINEQQDGLEENKLLEQVAHLLDEALIQIERELPVHLSVVASSIHTNTQNFYDAHMEALSIANHYSFLHLNKSVITPQDISVSPLSSWIAAKNDLERNWFEAIVRLDLDQAEPLLQKLIDLRLTAPRTASTLKPELIHRLSYMLFLLDDSVHLYDQFPTLLLREIERLSSAKSGAEIKLQVHDIFASIKLHYQHTGEAKAESGTAWVPQITAYIRSNYAEPQLNATMISERFGLTPAYISHLYHETTGVKLLDFLHTVRIEKAKALLLNTDMSLLDIAQRCGYYDRYAFSRVFSRYVGISPSEYRRK